MMTEREINEINDLSIWIERNIENKLSISDVQAVSGYSHWHLQRIFKKRTGISMAKYILNRRLSLACQLLRETDMSIVEVAEKYCWDSQDTFTRIFKKKLGITPFRWRNLSENQFKYYDDFFSEMITLKK